MAAAKTRKPRPLSWPQQRFLRALAAGISPAAYITGQAAHGGLEGTRYSLLRRGLIEAARQGEQLDKLTDAGRAALGLTNDDETRS